MISFLFRKMWKNKWLMLCLLAGNILIIGVAAATPMYSMATITRMIHQSMRLHQAEENAYPVFTQLRYVFNLADDPAGVYAETRDIVFPQMLDAVNIPVTQSVRAYQMSGLTMQPAVARPSRVVTLNMWAVQNMEENVNLVAGRMPSPFPEVLNVTHVRDGVHTPMQVEVIEALATDIAKFRNDFVMGELMRVLNVYDRAAGNPHIYVRVVGMIELPHEFLPFWAIKDIHFTQDLIICEQLVQNRIIPQYHPDYRLSVTWSTVHDYSQMTAGGVAGYMSGINYLEERFIAVSKWSFTQNFYDTLYGHIERMGEFNITLFIMQVPLYALLAFYVYVVSRKILQLEQNDISVIKSRGASRKQIMGIYAGQGLVVGLISFPAGLALGVGICHLLGASSGFLDMSQRAPIVVQLTEQAFLFGLVAVVFSFCSMVLPVIKFSKVGIVEHKRRKDGKIQKPVWQRYFLDVVFLGLSIFALYNFNIQQELAGAVNDFVDPTLFLASTLFMMGLGLLCLRVFPYIVQFVFYLGRRNMPISLYTAMVRVARSVGEEQFIMIFLVLTMSIGIFSAQAARTINLNAEHEILYLGGTDLIFRETWANNKGVYLVNHAAGNPAELVFIEPSFERFTDFEEIDALTRVFYETIDVEARPPVGAVRRFQSTLMGIDTQSFGETVWFRDDILPIHINYYLNVLSQVPNGVLVSSDLRDMGLSVGNSIAMHHTVVIPTGTAPVHVHFTAWGTIVGFIDRWPAFMPFEIQEAADGNVSVVENSMIVGNLGFFQNEWGVMPYQVWARTNTDNIDFFREFVEYEPTIIDILQDTTRAIVLGRQDPLLQGTNGILTVNFIVTLVVCFTGFLLYWILSIRERVLQFGIFRAMGMGLRSIIGMLINEQMLITLTALIIGAAVGEISARLFVPMIQIAYTSQVIPLLVVMEISDYASLFIVMGAMIIICLTVLITFISRIRIDQALKLGED